MPKTFRPQRHHPTSLTQQKIIANAVLPALRRGPKRDTEGGNPPRFTTHGAGRTPKTGPGPQILDERYLAYTDPTPELDLPALAIVLDEPVMDDATDMCNWIDWRDLWNAAEHTNITNLYYLRHHPEASWYAARNPNAGGASSAALTIVSLANIHGSITLRNDGEWL